MGITIPSVRTAIPHRRPVPGLAVRATERTTPADLDRPGTTGFMPVLPPQAADTMAMMDLASIPHDPGFMSRLSQGHAPGLLAGIVTVETQIMSQIHREAAALRAEKGYALAQGILVVETEGRRDVRA